MIRKLQINNYKSLQELELDVSRFNVLIGENGCGKSNVLEAIALAAAAAAKKLDNEFLISRGIRVTDPQMMRAAFIHENSEKSIEIEACFENVDTAQKYTLFNDNQPYSKWSQVIDDLIAFWVLSNDSLRELKNLELKDDPKHPLKIRDTSDFIEILQKAIKNEKGIEFNEKTGKRLLFELEKFKNFLIYSPENSALRNFNKEGQIEPLGINGEGLLKLLKVIQSKSPEQLEEIVTCLELFDWFDSLLIPEDFSTAENKVTITDRFLSTAFDQRSANEGFLFVLFYIALMVSDDTPKIFAIDNIDVALNPKLCTKLIKELVRLAKKYDKQVFVTTHNPAILDGIDLGDDEQRLLVLSRNKQGHTRVKRIELKDKPRSSTDEELRLSEAFLRGYLGGLPKGF